MNQTQPVPAYGAMPQQQQSGMPQQQYGVMPQQQHDFKAPQTQISEKHSNPYDVDHLPPSQPLANTADRALAPHPTQAGFQYKTATPLQALGQSPAPVDCPVCAGRHMTRIDYAVGGTTWVWAAAVCCLCSLGCIPFFINGCKNIKHHCGGCGALLATYHRNSPVELHAHA